MIDTWILSAEFVPVRCTLERAWRAADGSDDHSPAVARWDTGPLGVDYLCKGCLDASLDYADSMGDVGEPEALTWVMRPADQYCGAHRWPAALCRDWSHGPFTDTFGRYVPPGSIAKDIMIEPWRVGMATPEYPCWCARPACTGCSPVVPQNFHPFTLGIDFTA